MISEILRPWAPRPPMNRVDTSRAKAGPQKRYQRGQEGAEDEEQQDDDEQKRQAFGLVPGLVGAGLVGDVGGDRAGEVKLQRGGRADLQEGLLKAVDDGLLGGDVGHIDMRLDDQLCGSAIARHGELLDREHPGDPARRRHFLSEHSLVGRRQRAPGVLADDDDLAVGVGVAEDRRGEGGGLRAGRAGGEELAVVVVHLAA